MIETNLQIITIDCGGTIFKTNKSTLCKSDVFKSLMEIDNNQNYIFIDQDPNTFRHFLNFLRFPNYFIPNDLIENVMILADYYGLDIETEMIIINCAGTVFKTTRSILSKIKFFESHIDNWKKNPQKHIHIDQDPEIFKHILNFLRFPNYIIPNNFIENVINLAEYYGLKIISDREQNKRLYIDTVTYRFNRHDDIYFNQNIIVKSIANLCLIIPDDYTFDSFHLIFYDSKNNTIFNYRDDIYISFLKKLTVKHCNLKKNI